MIDFRKESMDKYNEKIEAKIKLPLLKTKQRLLLNFMYALTKYGKKAFFLIGGVVTEIVGITSNRGFFGGPYIPGSGAIVWGTALVVQNELDKLDSSKIKLCNEIKADIEELNKTGCKEYREYEEFDEENCETDSEVNDYEGEM